MIEVPVSSAVLVFLLVTVAFVLVVWFLTERRRPGEDNRKKIEDHVLKCPICTHVYLETRPGGMSKCPRCGSLNTEQEIEKVDLRKK